MAGKRGLHLRGSRNWIADGTHSCVLLFTAMPGTQSQREAHLKGLDGAWLPGTGGWVARMFFSVLHIRLLLKPQLLNPDKASFLYKSYAAIVEDADDMSKALMDWLDEKSLGDLANTIVILTGDNWEMFGNHDRRRKQTQRDRFGKWYSWCRGRR